ncbi:MAG: DUF4911 domain-containing protein [Halanaerobiaceae bacterium]
MEKDTQQIKVQVPQEEIVFLDMVFKSYEGLASLTISPDQDNVVYLDVTEGTKSDVLDILENFKSEFPVEIINK